MAQSHFSRLRKDRNGNFGLITAALLPVLLAAAGIAIDLTNAMQMKGNMQGAADSAALGAAAAMADKGLSEDQAKAQAKAYLFSELAKFVSASGTVSDTDPSMKDLESNTAVVVSQTGTTTSGQTFNVAVNTSYNLPLSGFTSFLGFKTIKVTVGGVAQSTTKAQNAVSMYLVLDRSGSMGDDTDTVNSSQPTKCTAYKSNGTCKTTATNYVVKIDALKAAVGSLLTTISNADPNMMYARLGAVSYNNAMQTPTSLDWGTSKVSSYVQALTATGSTNSGDAMTTAYNSLNSSTEATAHKNKNGQSDPSKFIVFMTDGENNIAGADDKTKTACANAKTAGIEVYSVAFMAPAAGQKLLSTCATDSSHYFDASDAVELVAAFKAIGEKASQVGTRLTN